MILVIGDIIVDEFIWGDVARISPEAPVPVVSVDHTDRRLGGSANVVRNLHALGMRSAMLGVIGDDESGHWVQDRLDQLGVDHTGLLTEENGRPTAIKTRVIARHQQVVRFDREWLQPISGHARIELKQHLQELLPHSKAVIVSDYGKGVLTPGFIDELIAMLGDKLVAVDPKPEHTDAYRGATVITPNLHEAAAMTGMKPHNDDAHVEQIARALHDRLKLKHVLITRSEHGMTLFDGHRVHHLPTAARDVFDVTGAGDTVIAVFTACLVHGDDPLSAARKANRAAGVVVGKVGTATASWDEISNHPAP